MVVSKPGAKTAEADQARKKAEQLLSWVKSGKTLDQAYAALGREAQAGVELADLGFLRKGLMGATFDDALFALKPGATSEIVKTDSGFHIIKLKELRQGKIKSYEEARAGVEEAYRREQAERAYFDKADQLTTLTYENPDTLDLASKTLALPVKESDFFGKDGGNGIAQNEKVRDAAFTPDVLTDGRNSEPVEIAENHTIVLRVKEHKAAAPKKLEEVREEIIQTIKRQHGRAEAEKQAKVVLDRLRSGTERKTLARESKFQWKEIKSAGREQPEVNIAVLRQAFKLARPQAGTGNFDLVALGDGDFAVVGVLGVEDAKSEGGDDNTRKMLREALAKKLGTDEWSEFTSELRKQSKVDVYQQQL
jgi:peptidyl-prolyl cis-trans isomerase D